MSIDWNKVRRGDKLVLDEVDFYSIESGYLYVTHPRTEGSFRVYQSMIVEHKPRPIKVGDRVTITSRSSWWTVRAIVADRALFCDADGEKTFSEALKDCKLSDRDG